MILTDEERLELIQGYCGYGHDDFDSVARAVEREVLRKLREQEPAWYTDQSTGDFCKVRRVGWTPLHIIPEVNE